MISLSPAARQREFTNLGVVAPGAKLYTYLSGSSTPHPVYTTAEGLTAHANPLVADSTGLFAAFYLGAGINYRFTLKTSADVVIWGPQDDVSNGGLGPVFDINAYGAVAGGVVDSTAAIQAACAALSAAGTGTLTGAPGVYAFNVGIGGTLGAFSSCVGVNIFLPGVTLADQLTYTGSDEANLFTFSACAHVRVEPLIATSQHQLVAKGLIGLQFSSACYDATIRYEQQGGSKAILITSNPPTTPQSARCSQFVITLTASHCQYGLLCEWSGDDLHAQLSTSDCGRNVYTIGAFRQIIEVDGVNQRGASIIGAFRGYGCQDIDLSYRDTVSSLNTAINEALILQYGDASPAEHRNISIHLDIVNPVASPFSTSLLISKVDANGNPDIVGRGHVLNGLTIDGTSSQISGVDHIAVNGYMVPGGDTVQNINVRNLKVSSLGVSNILLGGILSAQQGYGYGLLDNIYNFPSGGIFAHDSFTITDATNATPIVITTAVNTDLYNGQQVTITGVGGNTNANTTCYVKRLTSKTFGLYSDSGLTTGIAGNGGYTTGGAGFLVGSAGSKVIYLGCVAANFTAGIPDIGIADYISCNISTGATQSATAKRFISTLINGNGYPTLVPSMTTTVRDAFLGITNGMIIYNTTTTKVECYEAGVWRTI